MTDKASTTSTTGKGKTGGQKLAEDQAQEIQNVKDSDVTGGGEASAVVDDDRGEAAVLGVDSGVEEGLYSTSEGEQYVTLNKDVLEEFFYPDTKRPAYRVLYTKGQVVPKSQIDAYNAQVEAAKNRENLEGDEAVRATIDSTTLASGTYPGLPADK